MKRKRGRPRILDSPGDLEAAFFQPNNDHCHNNGKMSLHHPSSTLSSSTPSTKIGDVSSSLHASTSGDVAAGDFPPWASDSPMFATMGDEPTPGGPLTEERIATLGIVKMNDYVKTGTRQQFWEEYYVRVVMQVRLGFNLVCALNDVVPNFKEFKRFTPIEIKIPFESHFGMIGNVLIKKIVTTT